MNKKYEDIQQQTIWKYKVNKKDMKMIQEMSKYEQNNKYEI